MSLFLFISAIISLALVAALAVAIVYYGSTAFSPSNVKASASQVINQAQQYDPAQAYRHYVEHSKDVLGGSAEEDEIVW